MSEEAQRLAEQEYPAQPTSGGGVRHPRREREAFIAGWLARSSRAGRVGTVQELEALPEKAIVVDRFGKGWQKNAEGKGYWWPEIIVQCGPLKLVYVPGRTDESD